MFKTKIRKKKIAKFEKSHLWFKTNYLNSLKKKNLHIIGVSVFLSEAPNIKTKILWITFFLLEVLKLTVEFPISEIFRGVNFMIPTSFHSNMYIGILEWNMIPVRPIRPHNLPDF